MSMQKTAKKRRMRQSAGDWALSAFCYGFAFVFSVLVLFPFWSVLMDSMSGALVKSGMRWWPEQFTLEAYRSVLSQKTLLTNYGNTFYRTGLGTVLCVGTTFFAAYPLSKREMPFNNLLSYAVLFTMYFGGGLIPQYLLYKQIGLIDNRLVLILPGMFSGYYILVMRNFISSIPKELEESAFIDGANELVIAGRIYFPLMLPIVATISLWAAVALWNEWFSAMIYIQTPGKQVMQVMLRRLLMESQLAALYDDPTFLLKQTPDAVKAVTIYVTILPILFLYPFVQRYFIAGLTGGAVKG